MSVGYNLVTNLRLLGFNSAEYATGPYNNVQIHADTFGQPNAQTKHFEVICHFLFNCLDSDLTKESFAHCWPAFQLKESREFANAAFKWLERLRKDGALGNTVVRKSYLEDCRGERH